MTYKAEYNEHNGGSAINGAEGVAEMNKFFKAVADSEIGSLIFNANEQWLAYCHVGLYDDEADISLDDLLLKAYVDGYLRAYEKILGGQDGQS